MATPRQNSAFRIEFKNAQDGRILKARIYLPKMISKTNKRFSGPLVCWKARYRLRIGDVSRMGSTIGDNWLQALIMATEAVRLHIPEAEEAVWVTPEGVPSWIVLPRTIPISWGHTFFSEMALHIKKSEERFGQAPQDR